MPSSALTSPGLRRAVFPAVAIAGLTLAGCSTDLTRDFGFTRDPPDAFAVTTRAPLSMPPDYNLRPPHPGASRPQEISEQQQAQEALTPQIALNGTPTGQDSAGQNALVQAAGPAAPKNIRAEVNNEAATEASQNGSFVNKLLFWRKEQPPGIVVDPQKEAQRIRENAALGRSQELGDTPIIQPKQKGWLEGLF